MSGEKWGYIDAKGNFAISAIYDEVNSFSCGLASVYVGERQQFINKSGKIQSTPSFDYATDFYYNYSRIYLNNQYGFMNNKLETTVQPYFYSATCMGDNGLFAGVMTSSSQVGYYDAKGTEKLPAIYSEAEIFQDGAAVVEVGEKCGVINSKGDYLISPTYDGLINLGHGLIGYIVGYKIGAMDLKGNTVIQPAYDDFNYPVDNQLIPVCMGEKWGYVDFKGNMKISAQYADATSFFEGYAWVALNEDAPLSLIDTKGNIVLTLGANDSPCTGFHNGLALIASYSENGSSYKYIDVKGKVAYTWSIRYDDYAPARTRAALSEDHGRHFNEMTLNFHSRMQDNVQPYSVKSN